MRFSFRGEGTNTSLGLIVRTWGAYRLNRKIPNAFEISRKASPERVTRRIFVPITTSWSILQLVCVCVCWLGNRSSAEPHVECRRLSATHTHRIHPCVALRWRSRDRTVKLRIPRRRRTLRRRRPRWPRRRRRPWTERRRPPSRRPTSWTWRRSAGRYWEAAAGGGPAASRARTRATSSSSSSTCGPAAAARGRAAVRGRSSARPRPPWARRPAVPCAWPWCSEPADRGRWLRSRPEGQSRLA